jgi:phenylacetate-coenzyme A ligase PaaK-like adenylate-forming protein
LDRALSDVAIYNSWREFDPGTDLPVDCRFASMPALTKKQIRQHVPRDLVPQNMDYQRGIASGEIQLVETSGTTDDKITNIWNQGWWDASERASWKLNSRMAEIATGEHREAILVNPRNVGIISDSIDLPMDERRLSRYLYLNEKTDPLSWSSGLLDRMIDELNVFQPAILESNPSYLARLCRYIALHNKKVFQPGAIVFTYEYPTRLHLAQIKRVFTSPLVSSYGTTETGYVFMQCERGFFHQNSEYCRVDFQPFKAGQGGPLTGRILVTPFNNPWSLILRFDTGDLVTIKEDCKCDCGRNGGLVLSSIDGRRVNLTVTGDGGLVTLNCLDQSLSALRGIDDYQLIQVDTFTCELLLVSNRPDKAQLAAEAAWALSDIYGRQTRISVNFVKDIRPENSGKYLYSRSLAPIDMEQYLEKKNCDNSYGSKSQ